MQSLSCSLYHGCFIFLIIFILLFIPHIQPSQIATNHHDDEEEPIILSISNIFTKAEIDDMLQLIDSNESVLTPTLTYQEDVFSKEAVDAEDSTLRVILYNHYY
jgi:hypothetical protein